jgi:hypothetical protein
MKNFLVVLAIVVLLAVGGLVKWACNVVVNSGKGVVEQTLVPENVIFNYEYFHDQYQAYIKLNNMLATAIEQEDAFLMASGDVMDKWSDAEGFEWQRIQQHIVGIKNQIDECTSKYNSASSKLNVKIFKDKNLPYRLGEN